MTPAAAPYGLVASDIERVSQRLRKLAEGHHPLLEAALDHVLGRGGKRIRPALVMLSGKLGRYHTERLVTLAASLEVVHTATLVHDDTIDQALSRRGIDTINTVWDGKVAILVGDFLFAQSARLAAQLNSVPIMSLLSETVMAMSSAELRQYASARSPSLDEADYLQRISGKTASLFSMCCEGAGIVSDQSDEHIAALRSFGANLGMAFQIVDDVLDIIGGEGDLGKAGGSDLRQGTLTLPAILFADTTQTRANLLREMKTSEGVNKLMNQIRTSDAPQKALERAREYVRVAQSALRCFPPSEAQEALVNLSEHVVERDH